jgi:uncharacterized protein with PIN domain
VSPPRFLADAMLERLARWLRVLGFDTECAAGPDGAVMEHAATEGRHLLTRDRRLAADAQALAPLLIRSDEPLEQLREVIEHFGLPVPDDLFRRCMLCNVSLVDEPGGHRRCPNCGRLYWEGSHTRRMRAALARTFGETE